MGLNESRVFVCIKYKNNKTSAIPAKKRQALLCPVTWVRTEKFPAQLTSTPKNIGNIEEDRRDGFWKNIHFGRVVVWCGLNWKILNFSEASIPPSVCSSVHPFLQIILCYVHICICCAAWNWTKSVPQTASTTFAISSVFILYGCDGQELLRYWSWKD